MNLGECPKCGKRVLHVRIESVVGTVGDKTNARCLTFCCIHCNQVLSVQMDSRAKTRLKRKPAES